MNKAILCILIVLLSVLIAGCTPAQQDKARELLGQHRCAAYSGYLCSAPDDCGAPYLDTIESYCCPIKCQTCNQSCDDGNDCTEDSCSKQTNYSCVFTKKHGACQNDGICSEAEVRCNGISTSNPSQIDRVTALNPSGTCRSYSGEGAVAEEVSEAGIGSCNIPNQLKGESNKDCPISCDDGDDSTSDWYDTHSSQCKNTPLCDDRDANTLDWVEKDSNECKHCPKHIVEEPQTDIINFTFGSQYINTSVERNPQCNDGICDKGEGVYYCPEDCYDVVELSKTKVMEDDKQITWQITNDENSQGWPAIYEDKILWKDSNRHSPYDTLYMYDISTNKKIKLVGEVQLAGVPDYRGDIITFRSYSKAYIINLKDNSKKMLDFVRTDPVTNGELVVCQEYLYNVETGESNYLDEIIPAAKNGGSFDIYGNLLIWVDDTGGYMGVEYYDLSTKTGKKLTGGFSGQPIVYDTKIYRGSGEVYDISDETYTPLGLSPGLDIYDDNHVFIGEKLTITNLKTKETISTDYWERAFTPKIYGNRVVWINQNEGTTELFLTEIK